MGPESELLLYGGSGAGLLTAFLTFYKLVIVPLKGELEDVRKEAVEAKDKASAIELHAATTFVSKGDLTDIIRRENAPVLQSISTINDNVTLLRQEMQRLEDRVG